MNQNQTVITNYFDGQLMADTKDTQEEPQYEPERIHIAFDDKEAEESYQANDKGYEKQPSFQRWLSNIGNELDEEGVEYDLDADSLPKDLPKKYL